MWDGKIFATWPLTIKKHGPMFGIKPKFDGPEYIEKHYHFWCRMCDTIHITNNVGLAKDICECPDYNGGTHHSIPPIRRATVLRLRNLRAS